MYDRVNLIAIEAFPFRASFVEAVQSLRILTGVRDPGMSLFRLCCAILLTRSCVCVCVGGSMGLSSRFHLSHTSRAGKLYDRPIYLAATNTTLLVHVAEVDEGKVFRGSDPLMFQPMSAVEHKV